MPNVYYRAGAQAIDSHATRAVLRTVADRIATTARRLAAAEGADISIGRESGTRPKGRPYERVTAEAATEWGQQFAPRRRILARAASLSARTGRR
jgi:hypothetical protein